MSRPAPLIAFVSLLVAGLVSLAPASSTAAGSTDDPGGGEGAASRLNAVQRNGVRNPIGSDGFTSARPYSGDFPDPTIVRARGRWYAYSTTFHSQNLPVMVSMNLRTWWPRGDAMPRAAKWAKTTKIGKKYFSTTWAPTVTRVGKKYVHVYATPLRNRATQFMCVSVSTANGPMGPFKDKTRRPLVCRRDQGVIDPFIFIAPNKSRWLLWKTEGIRGSQPTHLWARRLTPSATAFSRGSAAHVLLTTQQPWEGNVIENPAMIYIARHYYLFYSANSFWNSTYATGYAVCRGPLGPCTRPTNQPLLATGGSVSGPGGAQPFQDSTGRLRLAYAAWNYGHTGYPSSTACLGTPAGCNQRRMHIASLAVKPNFALTVTDRG